MTTDAWFWIILNLGVFVASMMLLDGAHRSHIAALKAMHDAELAGMRTYIRTLNRERKWLEAELARAKAKLAQRDQVTADPVHIQWLPPSEEYDERE